MAKLRISIVEYLNTAPLVWGFTDGPLKGKYELEFTVPSQCAESLRRGTADVAIIPAVEYQRMDHVVVLPGMSVAAKGPVRSILVIAKKPIEMAKRIALDTSSRSSQALVRILCKERWNITPDFVPAAPEPSAMLDEADAALLIGDPALRVVVKMDEMAARMASDGTCCGGDPNDLPVPGHETLFVYDVAHEWREMTGLPCVLALWVARRGAATPEVLSDFIASKEYGMARLLAIAEGAEAKLKMPAEELESYLRNNIDFSLDEENLSGLELYFQKCTELGLIPRAKAVEFVEAEKKVAGSR